MRSGLTDPSTIVLAVVAVVLAAVAYVKDPGLPALGVKNGLPRLVPALIVAGLFQVLVPQEVVARCFGREGGFKAILVAAAAGMVTPGGPMVSVPLPVLAGWLVALYYSE